MIFLLAGVWFFNQTDNIWFYCPDQHETLGLSKSMEICFKFLPHNFSSLVPIKRPKMVMIIFLGCSGHFDPGYLTYFKHIKQKCGANFFYLKFPEAFYSYLMPAHHPPSQTYSAHSAKERKALGQDSQASDQGSGEKAFKICFSHFLSKPKIFRLSFVFLTVSLLERSNCLNYRASTRKYIDGLCVIILMVVKNIIPYDGMLRRH